jgi:dTDP-4-dehydrorhamnose reductase
MASKYPIKPKVFIMGLSGFIGYHLARKLREKFTVVGCYFQNAVHIKDVHALPVSLKNDTEMLERMLAIQSPDIAITAVGISDPKIIHDNAKLAENINISLPLAFALATLRCRAKHVFINSADLFDGIAGNYTEDTKDYSTAPGIAKMKVTAEAYIRAQTMEGTTLRVGKVLGLGHQYRPSLVDDLRSKLMGEKIFYADHLKTQSYLSAKSFAEAVEQVLLQPFPPNKQRILHVGGPKATEMEMCQVLSMAMGLNPKFLKPHPGSSETKIDLSMQSKLMESSFAWKEESREQLINNILDEMKPGLNLPRHDLRAKKSGASAAGGAAKTKTGKKPAGKSV